MSKRYLVAALALTSISISACNKGSDAPSAPPSGKALMMSDRDLLATSVGKGAQIVDQKNRRAFSKIFGGATGRDVREFVDERLKYFFTPDDIKRFRYVTAPPIHDGWYQTDPADVDDEKKSSENGEVGASNFSAGLFIEGMIEGHKVVISDGHEEIVIDTPRVGIMKMGPGYKTTLKLPNRTILVPVSMRQATLVHEARHSDCSIDSSVDDFRVGRTAKSMRKFLQGLKNIECGHLHELCPSGDFKALPACDRQPWGAYSVGLVFKTARLKDATDEIERRFLEGSIADNATRLLFDVNDMINGEMGEPKMEPALIRW